MTPQMEAVKVLSDHVDRQAELFQKMIDLQKSQINDLAKENKELRDKLNEVIIFANRTRSMVEHIRNTRSVL